MDLLKSQAGAQFTVHVQMGAVDLAAPIIEWLKDCADVTQVSDASAADLHIWDWSAFAYHKQLGDAMPQHFVVVDVDTDTGFTTAEFEQQVLMQRAEYVPYPKDVDTLLLRLSLIIQRIRYVQTLESLTVSDPLTGVFNRRKFEQELDKSWRQGLRQHTPCSLLFIDVDFFKRFNDRYGHVAGDECLRELASIFKHAAVRPHDVVARIGGEEFAMILPETPEMGARYIANQIIQWVARRQMPNENTPLGYVTVSIGVATVQPSGQKQLKAWQEQADEALYSAKKAGRNQVKTGASELLNPESQTA